MARKCLKCGVLFVSKDKSRRICSPCKQTKGPASTNNAATRKKLKAALKRRGVKVEKWQPGAFRIKKQGD